MPSHSQYDQRDSSPLEEVHAQWSGGVNTVLPADRLPALNFTHALNMELRAGYPQTRRSVERARWLYRKGLPLGKTFQGCGLVQGTAPDPATRLPTALLVVVDNALWLCAPNNEPTLLDPAVTNSTQPVEILDCFNEQLILRGLSQPPLRYKYRSGQVPRALPAPRAIGAFAQLPASETGCYAADRAWLKFGKSSVVASDAMEWDFDQVLQQFTVDDGENDEIIRLWPYGEDRIVVFKSRSVHVIDGVSAMDTTSDPPVLPRIYRVAAARGCVAPYSVAQRGGSVLYLSREGVEVLDLSSAAVASQNAIPLSKAADRYFGEVKWTGIAGARAAIADNYYLLSVPTRFGEARLYPYPLVVAPWDVDGDPPAEWVPTTVGDDFNRSCSLADPIDNAPVLPEVPLETLSRVDHYGQLGFEASYLGDPTTSNWWHQCAHICYCDGPEVESVPLVTAYERYSVRWRAMITGGRVYYGRMGQPWGPAPAELFPEGVLYGVEQLSLGFDANARPCFATVRSGRISLRRWVAGVATVYSWPGTYPRLFFNGLLQRDDTLRDVVCLYLRHRTLCSRMQRDNFGVAYTQANPALPAGPYQLAQLGPTGRDRGASSDYQLLAALTTTGVPLLLRSAAYSPWPFFALDTGAAPAYGIESIAYDWMIVELGEYAETSTAVPYAIDSLEYLPLTVDIAGGTDAGSAPAYGVDSLTYNLVVVDGGTYSDAGSAPAYGVDSLTYNLVVVDGGSYSEAGAAPAYGVDSITYE